MSNPSHTPKRFSNVSPGDAFSEEQLRQVKLNNELQERIIHEKEVFVLGSKIEHARRNIDALTHINTEEYYRDLKPIVVEMMKKNIEILGEVKDIK